MNKNLILLLSLVSFIGCGSSSSDTKTMDLASYLPSTSMTKDYTYVTKIDGNLDNFTYSDTVVVESNLLSVKKDGRLNRFITIKTDEVEINYLDDTNSSKIMKRNISEGDVVSNYLKKDEVEVLKVGSQEIGEEQTRIEEECTFDSMTDRYEKYFFEYKNYDNNHDIMIIKCITKTIVETKVDSQYVDSVSYTNGVVESKDDVSYLYLQKGLGTIATINDDCLASILPDVIDDTLEPEQCLGERYEYNLYEPIY
jgi:hypothetical protein